MKSKQQLTEKQLGVIKDALSTVREIMDLTGPEECGVLGKIRSKALILTADLRLLKKGAAE